MKPYSVGKKIHLINSKLFCKSISNLCIIVADIRDSEWPDTNLRIDEINPSIEGTHIA